MNQTDFTTIALVVAISSIEQSNNLEISSSMRRSYWKRERKQTDEGSTLRGGKIAEIQQDQLIDSGCVEYVFVYFFVVIYFSDTALHICVLNSIPDTVGGILLYSGAMTITLYSILF